MRTIGLIIVLFIFWLLLSGHYTVFLISIGLISSVAIALFMRSMRVVDEEAQSFHLLGRALIYWPWLLLEICKASVGVVRLILNPALPISPTMRTVKASQKSALGVTIFANSITLTPGTISIERDGDSILVHAITREGWEELAEGEMDRRATAFEGKS
ncbi:MAG: Na+/H+ antiporter subunit E [Hyphomicrobiales bacterium]